MINSKIVLLVDDDIEDQLFFKDAASKFMHEFTFPTVNNGKEALDYLQNNLPPDMIFMDLNMPVINGIECLRRIKESDEHKHIPVVIFSTSNNPLDIHITRKIGASLFFHKPDNFGELCNKVDRLLGSELLLQQTEEYII